MQPSLSPPLYRFTVIATEHERRAENHSRVVEDKGELRHSVPIAWHGTCRLYQIRPAPYSLGCLRLPPNSLSLSWTRGQITASVLHRFRRCRSTSRSNERHFGPPTGYLSTNQSPPSPVQQMPSWICCSLTGTSLQSPTVFPLDCHVLRPLPLA